MKILIVVDMQNDFVSMALGTSEAQTIVPARIRMCTLYAYSQTLNGRVVNTCNKSEN